MANGMHDSGTTALPPQLTSQDALICPSARCEDGAVVLGVIVSTGVVGYISPALPVNAEFAERARRAGSHETRFRFALPCQENGCQNWTAGRCGVIEDALVSAGNIDELRNRAESDLPRCSIRRSCRWFAQRGPDSCRICPFLFNHVWPLQHDK